MLICLAPLLVLAAVTMLGLQRLGAAADDALDARRQGAIEEAAEELRWEAEVAGWEIDLMVGATLDRVAALARHPIVVAGAQAATPDANTLLAGELEGSAELVSIGFTDRNGHYAGWAGDGAPVPEDAQVAESWWQGAWGSGVNITGLTGEESTGHSVVVIAYRISGGQGEPVGVLQASLAVEAIQAAVGRSRRGGTEMELVTAGAGAGLIADGEGQASAEVEWDRTLGAAGASLAPPEWLVVASRPAPAPASAASGSLGPIETLSGEVSDAGVELLLVVVVVILFGFFVAAAMSGALSRQVVDPLVRLAAQARRAAETGAAPGAWFDPGAGIEVRELQELARSFGSAQRTAAQLIEAEAGRRQAAIELSGSLGRRSRSLVERQLGLLDRLERSESDPDRLASLFELDHLAARMRRTAENMLVVTDQRPPPAHSGPVRIELVVHGALAGIEHYRRVNASRLEPVSLAGPAVADAAQLLAELVENALACSPPEASVAITGASYHDHYRLSVIDRGSGLAADELAAANSQLAAGGDAQATARRGLGLLIVARLSARHGIGARLEPADGGGIAARVEIPHALIQTGGEVAPVAEPASSVAA
jgi:signal transduction histidine kinase